MAIYIYVKPGDIPQPEGFGLLASPGKCPPQPNAVASLAKSHRVSRFVQRYIWLNAIGGRGEL